MSGGGGQSSKTTQSLPPWLVPYAQNFISAYSNAAMPGGQVAPFPSGLNQQVAPFDPSQTAAMANITNLTGPATGFAGVGAGGLVNQIAGPTQGMAQSTLQNIMGGSTAALTQDQINATLGGQYLNPASNPWLAATYQAAAAPMVMNYQNAIAPSTMAAAQRAGQFGSSGMNEALAQNQYSLGNNLANLAAGIYGPAYQQERGIQSQVAGQQSAQELQAAQQQGQLGLGAIQAIPSTLAALYAPQQAMFGAGAQQQQQAQTTLDTQYQNALTAAEWPFNILSGLGGAISQAAGGQGISRTSVSGGGGLFGSAICRETYRQGRMSKEMYEADEQFGATLSPNTYRGYLLIALPIVAAMRKSRTFSNLIIPLVLLWAREMKFQVTGKGKGSLFGRLLLLLGIPLCRFIDGCQNRFLNRPSVSQAITNCISSESHSLSPFGGRKSLTVYREHGPRTLISRLLFSCRPSNISRLIISRRVWKSINLMGIRWCRTSIAQESREAVFPFIAHRNSPGSVTGIGNAVRLKTSRLGVHPSFVCSSSQSFPFSFSRVAVLCRKINLQATAAFYVPTAKFFAGHYYKIRALTLTQPVRLSIRPSMRKYKRRQPSKLFPGNVFEIAGSVCRIGFSHIDLLIRSLVRAPGRCHPIRGLFIFRPMDLGRQVKK